MVSTSNAPGGLFESIEKVSERLKMDYNYELDKIYAKQKKHRRQVLSLKENIL
jgi:hypothetical protein